MQYIPLIGRSRRFTLPVSVPAVGTMLLFATDRDFRAVMATAEFVYKQRHAWHCYRGRGLLKAPNGLGYTISRENPDCASVAKDAA